MNLLSHLQLSEGLPPLAVAGNVLADYLRRSEVALGDTPPDFRQGVILHRAIDAFTDTHPVVMRSRRLISPGRRRLAGIILDIAFDHFLTLHWPRFCTRDREGSIRESYAGLLAAARGISPALEGHVHWMRDVDLLGSYTTIEGLAMAYRRVSRRSSAAAPLAGAEEEVLRHRDAVETAFLDFYPELVVCVEAFISESPRPVSARPEPDSP